MEADFGSFYDMVHDKNVTESKDTPEVEAESNFVDPDVSNIVDSVFDEVQWVNRIDEAMSEEEIETKIMNLIGEGLGRADMGYWYSSKRDERDGIVYEFISEEAPTIEVKVVLGDRNAE